jgi:hypothetical protein
MGEEDYYKLYLDIGVLMTDVTKKDYNQHDQQRKTDQELYSAKPERNKVLQVKRKLEKISAE